MVERHATPAEARLEREDLVAVARSLRALERPVAEESAAARAVWPSILGGIPATLTPGVRAQIAAAVAAAQRLPLPALMNEREAAALTGPAAPLAGRYRYFQELCTRSWRMIAADLREIETGSRAGAAFARASVNLYIEGVYDAHYLLADTGKVLAAGYRTLGGTAHLGAVLSEAEIAQLASAYSRANILLSPHERVQLGS